MINPIRWYRQRRVRQLSGENLVRLLAEIGRYSLEAPFGSDATELSDDDLVVRISRVRARAERQQVSLRDLVTRMPTVRNDYSTLDEPDTFLEDFLGKLGTEDYEQFRLAYKGHFEALEDLRLGYQDIKEERAKKRLEQRREDDTNSNEISGRLEETKNRLIGDHGPWMSIRPGHYTSELETQIQKLEGVQGELNALLTGKRMRAMHSEVRRGFLQERISDRIRAVEDPLLRLYRRDLDTRRRFRKAILNQDHATVLGLFQEGELDCNLGLVDGPLGKLVHGISPSVPDRDGSWQYSHTACTAQAYADMIQDILENGLKASNRRHGNTSDRELPAVYLFEYSGEVTGYGGVKVIADASGIENPIFSNSHDEKLIYTPRLVTDFAVELQYIRTAHSAKLRDEREEKRFYLDVREELARRSIPFQEHDSFKGMERSLQTA